MIRFIIRVYMFVIFLDVILSYIPQLRFHPVRKKINQLAEYTCAPIRKFLPPSLPFDLSPMIVIFLLVMFIELFNLLW